MGSSPILAIVPFWLLWVKDGLAYTCAYQYIVATSWHWNATIVKSIQMCLLVIIHRRRRTETYLDLRRLHPSVQWCSGYHARFTRERSWVRPPVEPGIVFWCRRISKKKKNLCMHSISSWLRSSTVVVAEWLRRWTRNPLGSPRAGSNPADNATFWFQAEERKVRKNAMKAKCLDRNRMLWFFVKVGSCMFLAWPQPLLLLTNKASKFLFQQTTQNS